MEESNLPTPPSQDSEPELHDDNYPTGQDQVPADKPLSPYFTVQSHERGPDLGCDQNFPVLKSIINI